MTSKITVKVAYAKLAAALNRAKIQTTRLVNILADLAQALASGASLADAISIAVTKANQDGANVAMLRAKRLLSQKATQQQ